MTSAKPLCGHLIDTQITPASQSGSEGLGRLGRLAQLRGRANPIKLADEQSPSVRAREGESNLSCQIFSRSPSVTDLSPFYLIRYVGSDELFCHWTSVSFSTVVWGGALLSKISRPAGAWMKGGLSAVAKTI